MWDMLNKISTIAQIITFVVFIGGVVLFLTRTIHYKRRIKNANKKCTENRVALAISLKPGENIKEQVRKFFDEKGLTFEIFEIKSEGVSLNTLPELRRQFVKTKMEISEKGAKEVHLFYEGPVSIAFFLADVFNNWIPVYIYHFLKAGGYECWGTLTESFEKIATEELIKEICNNT